MIRKLTLLIITLCCLSVKAQSVDSDEDEPKDVNLVFGYVSKQWSSKINGQTIHENLWGEKGKRLHGVQLGLAYTPTLPVGIGAYTGLFGEVYISFSKAMGFDEFSEFSLYVPLHARIAVPISPKVAIDLHGGFGLNYACHGGFTNDDAYYWDYVWDTVLDCYTLQRRHYELDHIRYGKDGWPKRFNAALEICAGIKIEKFTISGTYSWGLTNHKLYTAGPNSGTSQDKLSISLGYGF